MSKYPQHYAMKKNRLEVMKAADWKCDICKGEASEIHHADETDDNHEPSNLIPLCRKCHLDIHKINTTKPIWDFHEIERQMMIHGLDAKDLGEAAGLNQVTILTILRVGSTKNSTMKKLADVFGISLEDMIISGEVRKPRRVSTTSYKRLNEAIKKAVEVRLSEANGVIDEDKFRKIARIQIAGSLRELFQVRSWVDIRGNNLEKAIKFLESEQGVKDWQEAMS